MSRCSALFFRESLCRAQEWQVPNEGVIVSFEVQLKERCSRWWHFLQRFTGTEILTGHLVQSSLICVPLRIVLCCDGEMIATAILDCVDLFLYVKNLVLSGFYPVCASMA